MSLIQNQRKKNHRVWTYGCEDIDETVRRGLDLVEIRFQRSESVLWASAGRNTLSDWGGVFRACGRQNALWVNESVFRAMEIKSTPSGNESVKGGQCATTGSGWTRVSAGRGGLQRGPTR